MYRFFFSTYRGDDKVLFLLQFGQTDRASWICSGYFCLFFFFPFFFGSKPAAGRRGWNAVRSAEWLSEGQPDHANTPPTYERKHSGRWKRFINCSSSPGWNREAVEARVTKKNNNKRVKEIVSPRANKACFPLMQL